MHRKPKMLPLGCYLLEFMKESNVLDNIYNEN